MSSHEHAGEASTPPGGFPPSSPNPSPQIDPVKASIAEAVRERQNEYLVHKTTKIKIGTWNVAAASGAENDLGIWFVKEQELTDHLVSLKLGEENAACKEEQKNIAETQSEATIKDDKHASPSSHAAAPEIGLYVLGLQEIVDVSSPLQVLTPYVDPVPTQRWRAAVERSIPLGYSLVAQQQLVGLYLLIFASPLVQPLISDVSVVNVMTGTMGATGNKGCVAARLVLGGVTKLLFVNSHLTAGNEKGSLERRNWDYGYILSRAKFAPVQHELASHKSEQEAIGDEDFAFWFGDLNYRLEGIPGEDVRRLLMLHTKGEYGKENKLPDEIAQLAYGEGGSDAPSATSAQAPSSITLFDGEEKQALSKQKAEEESPPGFASDPTSLQSTLSSLLTHDQLHSQMEKRKAFSEGWKEGDITFPPSYKYDKGTVSTFDSSEKMRSPSWCDRVVYRTKQDMIAAQKRSAEADLKSPKLDTRPSTSSDVLFDYNPADDAEDIEKIFDTPPPQNDEITLHHYISHQSITSSDHKPVEALFTLRYPAEDPVAKSATYWKIARLYDDVENENRPRVTIVSNPIPLSEPRTIDAGPLKPGIEQRTELTIANTGTKDAALTLVHAGKDTGAVPPWLQVKAWGAWKDGKRGLKVGDVATIRLVLGIENVEEGLKEMGEEEKEVEHILVVRVEEGSDYFVTIRGKWLPSVGN